MIGLAWRLRWGAAIIGTRPTCHDLIRVAKYIPDDGVWERMNGAGEWIVAMTVGEWRLKIALIRSLYYPESCSDGVDIETYTVKRSAESILKRRKRRYTYVMVEYDGGKRVEGSEEELWSYVDGADTDRGVQL